MNATILAAGQGTRLRPYTDTQPKALVSLAGTPLLFRQMTVLKSLGIADIVVVTGYRSEAITALGVPTIFNPRYRETGMVASLMCARSTLHKTSNTIISYSDIVYEKRVLHALIEAQGDICVAIDRNWKKLWEVRMEDPLKDAETLKLDENDLIVEIGKIPKSYDSIQGQYMGLLKVSPSGARTMVRFFDELASNTSYADQSRDNIDMTTFLQYLTDNKQPITAVPLSGGWLEVDSKKDLDTFNQMHEEGTLDQFIKLD